MAAESRQYGLWDSPITPRSLAEDKRLDTARYDSAGRTLVWLEGRSGHGVLVCQSEPGEAVRDLTSDLSVRAEVGYGGGDFAVGGGQVYFAVHRTGRLYRQAIAGGKAKPITPAFGQAASPVVSPDGKWLIYVHHDGTDDRLAIVDTEGKLWPQILTSGHDFYMQPRWSPDGRQVAWIAWDHPNMPWDGTLLYVATVEYPGGGLPRLGAPRVVAGGKEIAVFQPEFTPDARRILFVSDETGWGRLAICDLSSGERRWLTPDGVEQGLPGWVQDMRTYAVGHDGRFAYAVANERGVCQVLRIDIQSGAAEAIAALKSYTDVTQVVAAPDGDRIAMIASSPSQPTRVIEYDTARDAARVVARASTEAVAAAELSPCEALSWKTAGGDTAHGLYFGPHNPRFIGSGKPPLVVLIHGGPTSQVRAGWRSDAQFFATRGYAVLFVNYRGSTGYGREYMLKLRGRWGQCDVEDAISGGNHLIEKGLIDPERTIIMGGSAGGFTVLQTLVDYPKSFTAGVCLYGVSDQFQLAADTHKFEARYTDTLIGPLPEAAAQYRRYSPAFHAEKIVRPLAVFQGVEDKVVPKEQSDVIVAALKRTGTPHIYHVYEGEGHGWRKRETIEHFWKAVDEFLRQYVIYR
jgi:dipeptidyl aminopeptidase/acylaminoacyl peptidase